MYKIKVKIICSQKITICKHRATCPVSLRCVIGELLGVTFAHFKKTCGMTDRIFSTNPTGPDVEHPIYMSRIQLVDVDEKSKLFAHHPQLT